VLSLEDLKLEDLKVEDLKLEDLIKGLAYAKAGEDVKD
jgi:hypothetical protein